MIYVFEDGPRPHVRRDLRQRRGVRDLKFFRVGIG